ncbi:hypothetical protein [Aurantimonas endophytica]|uniref:Uncharacterized protein n=1 Tax=Aurantimonas endophytica TaxID=1522175 RepID=A0A7W6HHW0_9HYPH|nr:hypothetical protein [Aurantimonas endophytica]MBB4005499.1 hypothetical protein [Aurantimonas endophytica]MCO6406527.1 hypothetical protein [Aurantimonas endophytica]
MAKRALLSRAELQPDDLLTLAHACELLLNSNLTPASLRRERDRGNLVTEKIANKEFVTPAEIQAMRERCRTESVPGAKPRPSLRDEVVGIGAYGKVMTVRDAEKAKLRALAESLPRRRKE